VSRRIFGPKREEATGEWIKSHRSNGTLQNSVSGRGLDVSGSG
jgi:hypothetical protein